MKHIIAATILSLTMSVATVYAADEAAVTTSFAPAPTRVAQSVSRPALLPALYASYAALQAYDIYSTRQALAQGGREANALMQGVAGNTSAMMAVKAGAVAGAVVAAEHLWKTNKPAAIAVMIASNGVAAVVAAHNAHTLKGIR
jgi:hypothetical protein